ncbi:MAG: M50 family metallopeptidase [Oscillospiraceae bacterium]|nr:M50 family metallopeptidase [Oscillospiraceae bacterium]
MARFLYILLAVVLFGIMIAIHEFGHFITAKMFRVKVNEFSIGMGPLLFSRKKGETVYSLRALPIGGFCAMEGEDEDTGDPRAFSRQAGWKKVIVLCAGAFMNFLLGLLIVILLYTGVSTVRVPVITQFAPEFSLEGEDGLMVGDRIKRVDGHGIWCYGDVHTYLSRNDGNGIDLVVERGGKDIVLEDFPMPIREYTFEGSTYRGFGLIFQQNETLSLLGRLKLGFVQTVDYVRTVWMSLADLVTGRVSVGQLSGVIGVVDVVSEAGAQSASAWEGILTVLDIMALISVNLAVMNLLPIPALDGGRILFILLNGVLWGLFRRRIPEKYEGYVHAGALFLLIALMVLVALKDVWNIFA